MRLRLPVRRPARLAAVLLAGLGSVVTLLVWAPPAGAVAPCDSYTTVWTADWAAQLPSTGYESGVLHCYLHRGNLGPGVLHLQYELNRCYGPSSISGGKHVFSPELAQDGQFGPRTEAALVAVQRFENVATSNYGEYGDNGRRKILFEGWQGQPDGSLLRRCGPFGFNT